MNFLFRLLHPLTPGEAEDPALEPALERVAGKIGANLKQTRAWPGRYRVAIGKALAQARRVAQGVPGPVTLDREHWVKDPFVHALFASAEEMRRLLSASPTLGDFIVAQGGGEVPEVEIIDKNQARQVRQKSWIFSSRLIEAIRLKLETGEKIFLFLNRRGFASLLLCDECGKGMHCPGCGVPLTFHKPDLLLCHRCNYSVKAPDTCPDCGKKSMRRFGMGTQQAFDELKRLFPQTPSGRLDADAAKDVLSAGQILADFRAGKTRILVGTQMAAGEELGGFGLLGVVLADFSMNIPDFRSPERTYQIISRLMGGLAAKEGGSRPLVIIQTYNPNHYVFSALKEGYDSFFRDESRIRRRLRYPPFSSLINLIISAGTEQKSAQAAEKIREALAARKGAAGRSGRFDMLGPAPAPVPVIRGKYRYEIMLKGKKTALDKLVDTVAEQRFGSKTEKVAVDVDPIRML